MITLPEKENCCGCGACCAICPRQAVLMKTDEEGFDYPEIDRKLCVSCGQCRCVCPVLPHGADDKESVFHPSKITGQMESEQAARTSADHLGNQTSFKQKYFAAYHKEQAVVERSSSGGVFTAVSDVVLESGGCIYGAALDGAFCVRHQKAENRERRDALCGSKYVQSDLTGIFQEIAEDLRKERPVLFSGTPCQVQAVKQYIAQKNISQEMLYTVDFICHGVASPAVWSAYKEWLEKKYHASLKQYTFRGKAKGWHNWYPAVLLENGEGQVSPSEELRKKNSYILMYQSLLFNRPSCFGCRFTSYDRPGDLTLGDFWNIKRIAPEMDTERGTSELLVNSPKGQELLDRAGKRLVLLECEKKDVWQPHLEYPNAAPKGRKTFWDCFIHEGMDETIRRYGKGDRMTRLKNFATPILKKTGLYVLFGKLYQKLFLK